MTGRESGLGLILMMVLSGTGLAQEGNFVDAPGGVIRWLDKLTGETGDVELQRQQSAVFGRLAIQLDSCRYPRDNPSAEAEAHLTIMDASQTAPVFAGWMLASSPALSAMEHPRYDVWVLHCILPAQAMPETDATESGEGE